MPEEEIKYEGCCLAHHRRVRWLAWPMWWYHMDDLSTCSQLIYCQSPLAYTTNLKLREWTRASC